MTVASASHESINLFGIIKIPLHWNVAGFEFSGYSVIFFLGVAITIFIYNTIAQYRKDMNTDESDKG